MKTSLLRSRVLAMVPSSLLTKAVAVANYELFKRKGQIDRELPDYYSFTTAFMVRRLLLSDFDPRQESILSVGCRVDHLLPFTCLFERVFHVSMVEMEDAQEVLAALGVSQFDQLVGDFFSQDPRCFLPFPTRRDVRIVLSHATVHCVSDHRYGNIAASEADEWGGAQRPYYFARKLRQLLPERKLDVILSCAVCHTENLDPQRAGGGWLDNSKFIESFESHGFTLASAIYDRHCGGRSQDTRSFPERFSQTLPGEIQPAQNYVIGNFHFQG